MRALFFDLDDTLIDRGQAFASWLRARAGGSHDLAGLLELDGYGHSDRLALCAAIVRELGLALEPEALFARMQVELPGHFTPAPRSRDLLAELAQRYRVAIVTNGMAPTQRAKLARTGLADVAQVFIASEVGAWKPARAIFERALAWAGCAPEQALFIGDHPELDIAGAAAAGLSTAWITHGRAWPAELPAPTWTLASVHELRERLA